jgi:hypothetical protein
MREIEELDQHTPLDLRKEGRSEVIETLVQVSSLTGR